MNDEIFETYSGEYLISTDKKRLDIDIIYNFIHSTYWGKNRTKEAQRKAIRYSLCFGVYKNEKQIGFGRMVTDYTTYVYILDFFILPPYQRQGIGTRFLQTIFKMPALKRVQHWSLTTRDAQGFYKKIRFNHLPHKNTRVPH